MIQYEHWANSLYPKLTCKDVTDRIEALAKKKEFKVHTCTRMPNYTPTHLFCLILRWLLVVSLSRGLLATVQAFLFLFLLLFKYVYIPYC